MKVIGCLVPELLREMHCKCRMQLFEQMQCFYIVTIMSPYTIMCSCKKAPWKLERQLGKTVVVKAGAYIVSVNRKTTVYRLKVCEIVFFFLFLRNAYQAVHSNTFHISLTCLWVQAYSIFIVAEPCFIIEYDTVQAPCNRLVQWSELSWKQHVWIKSPLNQTQYLSKVPTFCSASHIYSY